MEAHPPNALERELDDGLLTDLIGVLESDTPRASTSTPDAMENFALETLSPGGVMTEEQRQRFLRSAFGFNPFTLGLRHAPPRLALHETYPDDGANTRRCVRRRRTSRGTRGA